MSNPSRRAFVMTVVAGTSALAASRVSAQAATQAAAPVLTEADPQAVALGYKADNTKVDKAKYPQHAADAGVDRRDQDGQFHLVLTDDRREGKDHDGLQT